MAKTPAPYRRLPGRGSGLISIATLWECETHLLLVTSWPSGESYRRFFFADIQAIIVRRTRRRLIVNCVLAALALLAAAPLLFNPPTTSLLVFVGIVSGLGLSFLLLNSLLGPTCTMHLQTPIQCEQVPAVRRARHVRRFLARIQPRILAAQPAVSESAPAPSDHPPAQQS